jgi:hypothetical protein
MNGYDAAGNAFHELGRMIRKRDKRIGGFGHVQTLQVNRA